MVTQSETSQQGLEQTGTEFQDFVIEDSTSEETLALERQILGGEQPVGEPVVEEVVTEEVAGPVAEEETPTPGVVQAPVVEPKAVEEPVAPQQRQFSQDEVSKMQSAWMRQIETAKREAEEVRQQLGKFNLDAEVEAQLRRQEQNLAAQYGEEDARLIVRSQSNIDAVREKNQLAHENQQLKQAQQTLMQQQELQAKNTIATQLITEHKLGADDYETLMTVNDPQVMVRLAQRLSTTTQRQTQAARQQRVPPETPTTRLENGLSTGSGAESYEQKAARISDKPGWEWTPEELAFMKGR